MINFNLSKKIFPLLVVIFSIFSEVFSFREWWANSPILDLTTENFNEYVGKEKYVIVKFYTRWCIHCKTMTPEYDKLQEIFKEKRKDILIARLEGSINEEISLYYGIQSYPRIVLFGPGSTDIKSVFRGHRNVLFMEKWIKTFAEKIPEKKKENKPFVNEENKQLKSTEVTNEFEYFKKEIFDMKNKIAMMDIDIDNLKKLNKKKKEEIKNEKSIKTNKIDKEKSYDSEFLNEMEIKLKKTNRNQSKGIFERYSKLDFLIFVCVIIFKIGALITFKNIFFKDKKGISFFEHQKI